MTLNVSFRPFDLGKWPNQAQIWNQLIQEVRLRLDIILKVSPNSIEIGIRWAANDRFGITLKVDLTIFYEIFAIDLKH